MSLQQFRTDTFLSKSTTAFVDHHLRTWLAMAVTRTLAVIDVAHCACESLLLFLSLSFIPPVRRFAPAPDGSVAAAAIATSSAYCCQYYADDDYCYRCDCNGCYCNHDCYHLYRVLTATALRNVCTQVLSGGLIIHGRYIQGFWNLWLLKERSTAMLSGVTGWGPLASAGTCQQVVGSRLRAWPLGFEWFRSEGLRVSGSRLV